MPKWKAGNISGIDEPEALKGFAPYDGPPLPFTGVMPCKLKRLRMKTNKNGDDMLSGLLEVHAPSKKDPKHKWHGAPLWFNLNQTEQGAPYTRAFLEGMGVKWTDFVNRTMLDEEEPPNVTKLGKLKLTGEETVKVALKGSKTSSAYPEKKAEVASWVQWDGKAAPADDDLDEDDDEDYDDDAEDMDDDDLDDDDEDDDSKPPF